MLHRTRWLWAIAVVFCCGWASPAWSQSAAYSFSASSGSFDTLVGGTHVPDIETDVGTSDSIPIGFSFVYNGTTYDSVIAMSDGFLSFNLAASTITSNNLDGAASSAYPLVAPLWDDLDGRAAGNVSFASYQTSGTAPNRVFTFEWKNWEWRYNSTDPVISFQVKLYETSNVVEFHYRQESGTPNTTLTNGASIGIADALSFLSVTNVFAPTVGVSSTIESDTISSRPATGTVYAFTPPSCLGVNGITAFNITSSSAGIHWTAGGTETQWQYTYDTTGFVLGTGMANLATNDTVTLTGLGADSTFDVYVRGICAAGDTAAWVGPITFSTPCSPVVAPFLETFDTTITPTCWTNVSVSGGPWEFSTDADYTAANAGDHTGNGGNYAWVDFSSSDQNVVLTTPVIDVSALSVPELRFWLYSHYTGTGLTTYNQLFVEAFDGSAWVQVDSLQGDNGGWTEYDYILTGNVYNTQFVQIRFVAESGGDINDYYNDLLIDDVQVDEAPTCPRPTGLTVVSTTDSNAVISWTSNATGADWAYLNIPAGTTPSGIGTIVSTNPATLSGLMPNTSYDFYVREICTAGDTSFWTGPITYNTACISVYPAPFSENFDGSNWTPGTGGSNTGDAISNCWTRNPATSSDFFWGTRTGTTSGTSTGPSSDNTTGSDNYVFTEGSNGSTGDSAWIATPAIDLTTLTNPYLEFAFHMYGSSIQTLYIEVNNGTGWILADSVVGAQQSANADPWGVKNVDLNSFITDTVQIRWITEKGGTNNDVAIDDVSVYNQNIDDLGVIGFIAPPTFCGDSNTPIIVIIENFGTATQTGFNVTMDWTGSSTGSVSTTYTGSLAFGEIDTVIIDTLNTFSGGTFNLFAFTALAGDQEAGNDTLAVPGVTFTPGNLAPTLTTASPVIVCAGDTAVFVATGAADTILWRGSDGTLLATGDTLQLLHVMQTDTFYASQGNIATGSVGPVDNSIGSGGNFASTSVQSLIFDVNSPMVIDSVTIYPSGSGDVDVVILDAQGDTVFSNTYSVTVAAAQDPVRLGLGASVPVGTGYRINGGNSTVGLYRNSAGASFPYASAGNEVVITGVTFSNQAYYYFFYDWAITSIGCESQSVMATLQVNSVVVDLGADTAYCADQAFGLTLDAGNAGAAFLWSDNSTGQTLLVDSAGVYWVEVTDPITNCVGTDTLEVTENALPMFALGNDTSYCSNEAFTTTLDAGNAGAIFLWNDNSSSQTLQVDTADTFWVEVTNAFGCTNTDTLVVSEHAAPMVALGNDTAYCADQAFGVTLDAGNAGATFLWSDNSTGQTLLADSAGVYWVEVTDPINGCVETDTLEVTENALPMVALGNDTAYCSNEAFNIMLDAGNAGANFLWSDNSSNQTLQVDTAGAFWVEVTDANGCVNTDTLVVSENAAPVVILGGTVQYCGNDDTFSLTIDAGNPGATYTWSDPSVTGQTLTLDTAGIYSVTVTDSNNCTGSDSIEVQELTPPSVTLEDTTICAGDTVTLDPGPNFSSYAWSTGSNAQTIDVTTAGTYTVVVRVGALPCAGTASSTVTVNPLPVVNLGADTGLSIGNSLTLDAGNPGADFLWSTGATTQTIDVDFADVPVTILVDVTDGAGCTGTDEIVITAFTGVDEATAQSNMRVYPNPANDRVHVEMATGHAGTLLLQVYNTNGALVRELHEAATGAEQQWVIDVNNLERGVYFIHAMLDDTVIGRIRMVKM